MALGTASALHQLNCYSDEFHFGLVNYADLIIADKDNNVVGLRFGGYPEQVMAMTDVIAAGCEMDLRSGDTGVIKLSSKNCNNFSHSTTRDGIYAESVLFLKDSEINAAGNKDDDKEKEAPPRTMYLYCKTDSKEELFAELDRKLSIPLIADFGDYLIDRLKKKNMLEKLEVCSEKFDKNRFALCTRQGTGF